MKIYKLMAAAAVALIVVFTARARLSSASRVGTDAPLQERTLEREMPATPGQKLSLDLETGGEVKIGGWDSNLVSIKAYLGGRDWRDCTVDIEQASDGVKVASRHAAGRDSYSTSFKFEIQVPQRFDVQIKSGGGGISITNLEGDVRGSTGGGAINVTEAKGKLNLSTGGGEITVTRSEVDGRVSTGGGRVIIHDVKGDFAGSSGGGNVELKNVTLPSGQSTGDEVRITNAGGSIQVDEAPAGADVRTGGGNIHIKSAVGFVKASTGGGNIQVDSVDGSVHATTGAGRISVAMTADSSQRKRDVEIMSGSGDITLTVPADLSMELDLKLGFTNTNRHYEIVSDFDMARETTHEWSSAEGTPRKYIYGRGSLAGGRNKIHIETVNGNIYLKRQP